MSATLRDFDHAHVRVVRGTNYSVQTCDEVGESKCPLIANARASIADRLHDSVVQELFALSLGLESLSKRALFLVGAIRDEIYGLRANAGLSFRDELELALKTFGHVTSVKIGRVDEVPVAYRPDVVDVVKESVSNAVRHGGAGRIAVDVHRANGSIEVAVVDNGRGCPPQCGSVGGLAGMTRRAQRMGGSFSLHPNATGGMLVQWKIPNKEEQND
jgi:signal transduction histidine kinase